MSRLLLLAMCGCSLSGPVRAADSDRDEPLTRIADVRALSRMEAQQALPVQVRGVVTQRDQYTTPPEWLVLDDGAQSIWVQMSIAKTNGIWKDDAAIWKQIEVGDMLGLEGVSHPGGYAPIIVPSHMRRMGTGKLPEARRVPMERLLSGAEDCQRIVLDGVIQGVKTSASSAEVRLAMHSQGHTFQLVAAQWSGSDPTKLIDAEVRVRGVFSPISNFRAEMVALRVWITGPQAIDVITAPPQNPFDAPRVSLDRLQPFSPEGTSSHRCVTQGIVTFCSPGEFFFVQEGDVAVRVQSPGVTVKVGDRVDIAGFVDMSRLVASLTGAVARRVETSAVPEAITTTAKQLLHPQKIISWERVLESDFDGRLVRLRGTLRNIEFSDEEDALRLQVETGSVNTSAYLMKPSLTDNDLWQSWAEGSEVDLTGVCELVFVNTAIPNMPRATSFRFWLRSPQDVRVLQTPPWWTPQRLSLLLLGMLVAFLFVFGWGFTLRRTLLRRTARLEEVMSHHRNAELEFQSAQQERQRLAVDLHDGLQQMITGVSYRLEAAIGQLDRDPTEAHTQLAATRRALSATKTGLRECLWGLRQVEEGPGDFTALLRHVVETNEHWPAGVVTFEAEGDPFPLSRDVMGGLLLLVQEAVSNALRHGDSRHVSLRLKYMIAGLELEIQDDGKGFDMLSVPTTEEGHYGLEGMRQRMNWLGGTVEIMSQPTHGTRIRIHLPHDRARTPDGSVPPTQLAPEAP